MKILFSKKLFSLKTCLFLICFQLFHDNMKAQSLAINTTGASAHASAILDVNGLNKGLLIPRISLTNINDVATIAGPATSLLVYNTNAAIIGGSGLGYYYFNGANWIKMSDAAMPNTPWGILGNAGTLDGTHFIGTTDNVALNFKVNNQKAGRIDQAGPTFLGYQAGNVNTGISNTGIGYQSLFSNTNGNYNTAIGSGTLNLNQTANFNTAVGYAALTSNNTGYENTANGGQALYSNSAGYKNTANGVNALYTNSTGNYNTANGHSALFTNNSGSENTAIGVQALYFNTTGYNNTANGVNALYRNTLGHSNTANGHSALFSNTTGNTNTANGDSALYFNTAGDANTAIGYQALYSNSGTSSANTANGYQSLYSNTTGFWNTASGYRSLYSNIDGYGNSAFGYFALYEAIGGRYNTAIGFDALHFNSVGLENTAVGYSTLNRNLSGFYNTGIGSGALSLNTIGNENTAIGWAALTQNTGYGNTAVGSLALSTSTTANANTAFGWQSLKSNTIGDGNTAIGTVSLAHNTTGIQNTTDGNTSLWLNTIGSYNTAIGYNTGPNANNYSNTTCLGIDATATASNMVRIGNAFVTSINGNVNFTVVSDGRIKENIKENVPGLNFIKLLRPVTYRLNRDKINEMSGLNDRKKQITDSAKSKTDIPKFLTGDKYSDVTTGFIAQEVEASAKKLGFDFSGVDKPKNDKDFYGLRYAEFVVPLVKGMQEQQAIIEDQNKRIERLEKMVKELSERIK